MTDETLDRIERLERAVLALIDRLDVQELNDVEAARELGRSPFTLRQWRLKDRGPAFTRSESGRISYRRADLLAYRQGELVRPKARTEPNFDNSLTIGGNP